MQWNQRNRNERGNQVKITKRQLKRIIKEEKQKLLNEIFPNEVAERYQSLEVWTRRAINYLDDWPGIDDVNHEFYTQLQDTAFQLEKLETLAKSRLNRK
jgi:hypothetical protein